MSSHTTAMLLVYIVDTSLTVVNVDSGSAFAAVFTLVRVFDNDLVVVFFLTPIPSLFFVIIFIFVLLLLADTTAHHPQVDYRVRWNFMFAS